MQARGKFMTKFNIVTTKSLGRVVTLFVCALTAGSGSANTWTNPAVGNWFVASNWSSGVVPDAGQDPVINDGGLALVSSAGAVAHDLVLGPSLFLSGNSGSLDVQGPGVLTLSDRLYLGVGTMQVSSGGRAIINGTEIGGFDFAGSLIVTGINSYVSSGSLSLANMGRLQIDSGGRVDTADATLGEGGSATVAGSNSLWSMNGVLDAGGAQVTVFNRGTVNAAATTINYNSTVTVTGAGSSLKNSSSATTTLIGYYYDGTLNVQSGGLFTSVNADVGQYGGAGFATVTGAGSTWNNSADLSIGVAFATNGFSASDGTMTIDSGGRVTSSTAEIGVQANNHGKVTVSGTGSTWANSGDIAVGQSGFGAVEVTGGATVTDFRTHLGFFPLATGTVTVSDPSSSWTAGGSFIIGNGGFGTLNVLNGALASTAGNSYLGFSVGATGYALVSGSFATWNTAGTLAIGGNLAASGGRRRVTDRERRRRERRRNDPLHHRRVGS